MRPRSGPPLVHCCRQPGIRYKYAFPARIPRMSLVLIIVIGWLYVTLLVAANEPTVTAGIISFLFYGALPCGLFLFFATSKVRRQRRAYRERLLAAQQASEPASPDDPGQK